MYWLAVFCIGLLSTVFFSPCLAQSFVFAQLQGTPVNTGGWTMTGSAHVGNIKSNDNSEIVLCTTGFSETGSIFYNQPIDLSKCNQWKAEFDFRIYDGTAADGIAFCFLDVPPTGFVSGYGIGIPGTSNGLKVVFDTYNNCASNYSYAVPKIELRWGRGYDECWSQPTLDNSNGKISFIRSDAYNHAVITYNAGNITVTVNNQLYLSGYQVIPLVGYLGFTSGTGGNYDNHSIKNVTIYTNVPALAAGENKSICAGQTVDIGSAPNELYHYQWSPADGLNSTTIANPTVTIENASNEDIMKTYYVTTSLADSSGCTATDSVTVRVKTLSPPSVSIVSTKSRFCDNDSPPLFTASSMAGGASPQYQWMVNGEPEGTDSNQFTLINPSNADQIMCTLINPESCAAVDSASSNTISLAVFPSPVVDAGSSVTINYGESAQLNAQASGEVASITWSPALGLSNSTIVNPVATPKATTLYTITATSNNGCTASDTVSVKMISKDVMVPTAFTPNGDGKNDLFMPIVLGATLDYRFAVYDRWGKNVFQSKTVGEGWDGTTNGAKQSSGIYVWKLWCKLDTNVIIDKQGTVALIL